MTLIEEHQLSVFYNAMGPTIEMSGGSVANSIAGVAALGGTCGYIGKVADDEFGERFTHDLRSLGAELDLAIAADGEGVTDAATSSSPTTPSAPWRPTSARPTS